MVVHVGASYPRGDQHHDLFGEAPGQRGAYRIGKSIAAGSSDQDYPWSEGSLENREEYCCWQ